ncbi:SDR family oxidoreductase [Pseudonocardia sp. NPDC049154]|uniref:SDR family oxidoreductase n=1 Tax=Pseudonocardia sp. NPDC049154 TaxID=3155501 RepID=UPI0033C80EBA
MTGGGSGLGAATCRAAQERGAVSVVVLDRDLPAAEAVAAEVNGHALRCDVADEAQLRAAVEQAGPIDVFVSNAGVGGGLEGPFVPDEHWNAAWRVNVLSNVYAARILLPGMLERGRGHLVSTASANALTTNPLYMPYAVTKSAQLSVAEWLAMTYGDRGIGVTCFCPKGMVTPMLLRGAERSAYARDALETAVTPEEAARIMLDAVEADRFMAVTHSFVADEFALKGKDYEAWIAHARGLHRDLATEAGHPPQT